LPARRHSPAARYVTAVLLALLANALGLLILDGIGFFDTLDSLKTMASNMKSPTASEPVTDDKPMEISTIEERLQQPDEKSEEEKKREEEKKKEEEAKTPHGQVVDVARPLVEERPESAKYVSEYDTRVEHETKLYGRDHGGAKDGAIPIPPSLPAGTAPNARPSQAQAQKGGRPGPLAMRDLQRPPAPHGAPDQLATAEDGDHPRSGENTMQPMRAPKNPGSGANALKHAQTATPEAPNGVPGVNQPNLQPSKEMLSRAIGKGGGSQDYLKEVDDGDATALNSKKWNFASFFNRVKRAVADQWHPELVYVQHDPNGNVYGVKDRVTVLRIHLAPDGKLAAWNVMQSSGVDFLDDEAIDAFKKAAPFPNPPKALVDPDGQIHFNFAFIFELSGRGSLKVYKYN
jgi:TonB family protein